KRILEILGIPHSVVNKEFVVLEKDHATILHSCFDIEHKKMKDVVMLFYQHKDKKTLELMNMISQVKLRDKAGVFIGARMGRPEKAKQRKLTGSPHMMFPVGEEGGRLRSLQSCLEEGTVTADFAMFRCDKCKRETVFKVCEKCKEKTRKLWNCPVCGFIQKEECEKHGLTQQSVKKSINIKEIFQDSLNLINFKTYPEMIKGVRGTANKEHIAEHICKGILRAKNDIHVNKDGTTRYDMTELPMTHFKPKEISTQIQKLIQLGYTKDIFGNPLVNENQILELKPQDVVLPECAESTDEGCAKVLLRIANFVDDLLINFYKTKPFYCLREAKDLIGHLVVCLAPHTSAGIVGRIIGFTQTQGFFAHPMLHAATRRDCFTYDTLIPIFDGTKWSNTKIGELVEKLNPTKIVDSFGTKEIKVDGYRTMGLNKKGEIAEVKINNFTKHTPTRITYIKTKTGRELRVTSSHKFLVWKDNKTIIKRTENLSKEDLLLLPKKLEFREQKTSQLDLTEIFSGREDIMIRGIKTKLKRLIKDDLQKQSKKTKLKITDLRNFYNRDSFSIQSLETLCQSYKISVKTISKNAKITAKRDTVLLPNIIQFDENLLEYLGLYVAEGYSRYVKGKKGLAQVYVASYDSKIRELVQKFGKRIGLKQSERKIDRVTFSSRIFYELIIDFFNCGSDAYSKRVPSVIFRLDKKLTSAFLRGYFEGDGSVSPSDIRVTCDSVSKELLYDIHLLLLKYGIQSRFYTYTKEPGPIVRDFYVRKGRKIPKFTITKLTIPSNYVKNFKEIGFISQRKQNILSEILKRKPRKLKNKNKSFLFDEIIELRKDKIEESYCLNVENHTVLANGVFTAQCDGDESCVILLMDTFLNFSKKYLPDTRGATMDAPLVLTSEVDPTGVDDMLFDVDIAWRYPLEFYEATLLFKSPKEIKIPQVKKFLGTPQQYEGYGFTHDVSDLNNTVRCSAYKTLPSMGEKVQGQMDLAEKIRAVDARDVAQLVIEKHFIKDTKGNLRKFSTQEFRCVACNTKFRRPPLIGKCTKCNGKLIFTVSEGNIIKYLEITMMLANKYNVPPYLKQTLELLQKRIEGVFGRDKEKQSALAVWAK
ncbi:MAG: LAGLIDADG family homing endonuclease, partial [Nanoarchaeota archaeon]